MIEKELVTLRYSDSCLGFYWPKGFDHVMIGSIHWNPKTSKYKFEGYKSPELYSVEEALELFNILLRGGAY